jgi:DNA-binding beta-propeller fold protein YncE
MRAFRFSFFVFLAAALFVPLCARSVHAQTTQAYFVTDSNDNLIRVFAVSNDQAITSFRAGLSPAVVAVSPDGGLAYVPNGNSGFLSVVDLTIDAEIFRVFGARGLTAAISPDGTRVVTTPSNVATPGVVVINTSDFSAATQNLGSLICDNSTPPACDSLASAVIVSSKAYFNTGGQGPLVGIVVLDLGPSPAAPFAVSGSAIGSVPGTPSASSIAATPDGKDVIAIENNPSALLVIDTTTNTVVQNLTPEIAPQALAVTSDPAAASVLAYIVGPDSSGNNVVEAYQFSGGSLSGPVATSAPLPLFANLAALSPDGTRLYLAQQSTSQVVVVDGSTLGVLEQLTVGTSIWGISAANIQTQPLSTAPVITSVTPQVAPNDTSTTVQITGSNFTSDALVRFGDLDPVPGTLSGSTLQATVPAGAASQGADIVVTDPNSTQPVSGQHQSGILRGQFTITNPPSFQPANQVIVADDGEASVGVLNGSTTSTLFQTTPGLTASIAVGVAITPDGSRAYLGGFVPQVVYDYNILTSTLEAAIPSPAATNANGLLAVGGQEDPVAVVNSPVTNGGPAVYAASAVPLPGGNINDYDLVVSMLDANPNNTTTFNKVVKQLQAGLNQPIFLPGGLAVTPDGRYAYANAQQSVRAPGWNFFTLVGSVVAFDVVTGATSVFDVSTLAPGGLAGFQGHIEVSPDGKSLLLLAANGGVAVFDIGTNPMNPSYVTTITGTPPAGFGPLNFLEYRIPKNVPNELVAFDSLQNVIQIFNFDRAGSNFSQLGSIVIPGSPGLRDAFGMDVTPDGKLVYGLLVQDDAVAVIDASNPANPVLLTKIRAGLTPGALAVRPGTPTQTGTNVTVQPIASATINFTSITSPGATTVTTTNVTPFGAPGDFQLAGIPIYYNVTTTAVFSGPIVACFTYDPNLLPSPESGLRLAHFDTTLSPPGWVDATVSLDTSTHQICGQVSSLSPFVIGVGTPTFEFDSLIGTISGTIQPDGIMRSLRATALAASASFSRGQNSTVASQLQALEQQISTDAPSWPSVASEQPQLDNMINSILSSLQ